jgi:NAD+ synthase
MSTTMTSKIIREKQQEISSDLGVNTLIKDDASLERDISMRIAFIKDRVKQAGASALVLGISGGVDSLVAGRLCQLAAEQLREEGLAVEFIAVRLPYKVQADESDAVKSLAFIRPDKTTTVNIADSVDGMMINLMIAATCQDPVKVDFVKGNVKARARMVAQYAIANFANGLVVGTDHACESVMGFFSKFGDGACDLAPLSGLIKGQVRSGAILLGAPQELAYKTPTADLEDLDPGKPDESAYGCTYEQIDAFLMGAEVEQEVAEKIIAQYENTAHKRALPYSPV